MDNTGAKRTRLGDRINAYVASERPLRKLAGNLSKRAKDAMNEATTLSLERIEITLDRLPKKLDGLKCVHLSDIHHSPFTDLKHIERAVKFANRLKPDIVLLTGDYVSHDSAYIAPVAETLAKLRSPMGTFACLGNHDHWTDADGVRRVLRESGLTELRNTVHTVKRGDAMLHLAGIDDYWERRDRLDEILGALPENGAAILLAHEPDYADISAATGRFDLQISGHSHGGQVIIPVLNRPVVIPTYGRKYPIGRYQVGTMIQYTNRGLGTVPPAVRFNCRPEITLFTLSGSTG